MEKIPGSALGHRSFGLDLARAMAISIVILSHFSKKFNNLGFWGVELFFGLSGFLIGQILWKSYSATINWSFRHITNFWSRRWWRTLPNYYLFLSITFFIQYFQNGSFPSFSLFVKHLWFGQNLLAGSESFFVVSWSLCIEEWFYLLFPLFLFIISKMRFKHTTSFILTLVIIFIGSFLVRERLISQNLASQVRFITLARLDAIACGVVVAFLILTTNSGLIRKWIFFLLGISILISTIYVDYFLNTTNNQYINVQFLLIFIPLGFSLTLPLIALIPKSKKVLNIVCIAVEKISLWSYSIYLCNLSILFTIYKVLDRVRSDTFTNFLSKLLGLGLTILLSAFIYRYFEVPFMKKRPGEIKD